jgi:hypothetical protein
MTATLKLPPPRTLKATFRPSGDQFGSVLYECPVRIWEGDPPEEEIR